MADQYPSALKRPPRFRWPLVILAAILVLAGLNHYYQWQPYPWAQKPAPPPPQPVTVAPPAPKSPTVIDFAKIRDESDLDLNRMIDQRKGDFGLAESVDMVVAPEEAIKVGRETVSVADIIDQIEGRAADGQGEEDLPVLNPESFEPLVERDIGETSPPLPEPQVVAGKPETPKPAEPPKPPQDFYGVYVVRGGDNLWDIHFSFLREYLKHMGMEVSDRADEGVGGRSTGVSRILKYAETLVHIYNMKTRKLDRNIHLLEPETKVVIFNLSHLDRILGDLKPGQLNRVRYDGRELFIEEPPAADGSS
jgi:hypothetical protein